MDLFMINKRKCNKHFKNYKKVVYEKKKKIFFVFETIYMIE